MPRNFAAIEPPIYESLNELIGENIIHKILYSDNKFVILESTSLKIYDIYYKLLLQENNVVDVDVFGCVCICITNLGVIKLCSLDQVDEPAFILLSKIEDSKSYVKLCYNHNYRILCLFYEHKLNIIKFSTDDGYSIISNTNIALHQYASIAYPIEVENCCFWGDVNLFVVGKLKGCGMLIISMNSDSTKDNMVQIVEHRIWITALSHHGILIGESSDSDNCYASGDSNGSISIWTSHDNNIVKILYAYKFCPNAIITSLFFNSNILWIGSTDGVITCCRVNYDNLLLIKLNVICVHMTSHSSFIFFTPDVSPISNGSANNAVRNKANMSSGMLLSISYYDGTVTRTKINEITNAIYTLSSPSSTSFVHSNDNMQLTEDQSRPRMTSHQNIVTSCLYISVLNAIVTATIDHIISVWSLETNKIITYIMLYENIQLHSESSNISTIAYYVVSDIIEDNIRKLEINLLFGIANGKLMEVLLKNNQKCNNVNQHSAYKSTNENSNIDTKTIFGKQSYTSAPNKMPLAFSALDIIENDGVSGQGYQLPIEDDAGDKPTASDDISFQLTYEIAPTTFASKFYNHPPLAITDIFFSSLMHAICICYGRCALYVHSLLLNKPILQIDLDAEDTIVDISLAKMFSNISQVSNSPTDNEVLLSEEDNLCLTLITKQVLKILNVLNGSILYEINLFKSFPELYDNLSENNYTIHDAIISFCSVCLLKHSDNSSNSAESLIASKQKSKKTRNVVKHERYTMLGVFVTQNGNLYTFENNKSGVVCNTISQHHLIDLLPPSNNSSATLFANEVCDTDNLGYLVTNVNLYTNVCSYDTIAIITSWRQIVVLKLDLVAAGDITDLVPVKKLFTYRFTSTKARILACTPLPDPMQITHDVSYTKLQNLNSTSRNHHDRKLKILVVLTSGTSFVLEF